MVIRIRDVSTEFPFLCVILCTTNLCLGQITLRFSYYRFKNKKILEVGTYSTHTVQGRIFEFIEKLQ